MKRILFVWLFMTLSLQAMDGVAQTCNEAIPETTPASRFIDHGDGIVSDKTTGLVWKKCAEGQTFNVASKGCDGTPVEYRYWDQVLRLAASVNAEGGFAGYADWRLPNIKELASIIERQCKEPAINSAIFPNAGASWDSFWDFWSASPPYADRAWAVNFTVGQTHVIHQENGNNDLYYEAAVRLVRGGQ